MRARGFRCYLLRVSLWRSVSVAQITAPGTVVRNVGSVAYQLGSGAARTALSNEVQLAVQPLPSRAAITLARYEAASPSSIHRGPDAVSFGQRLFPPGSAVAAGRRPARSDAADSAAGHHASRTPVTRSSCAWSISTATATATSSKPSMCASRCASRVIPRCCGCRRPARTPACSWATSRPAPSAASADCALQVERNAELDATYVDPTDNTDAAQADALVDPYGLVFDSQTGAPINGARVRLVDVDHGPAGHGLRR